MPDSRFDELEACLQALETGTGPQLIINAHPELRGEIEAASLVNSIRGPQISAETQQRSRTRLLAYAANLRADQPVSPGLLNRLPRVAIAAILALLVFLTGSSLMVTSARSLPGDQLYPVKRAVEELRLNLSSDPNTQETIEAQYHERRIEEVLALLERGRTESITFAGLVNHLGVRHWTVGDVMVIVTPETLLIGDIGPGMEVDVEGVTQPEGWVLASVIRLRAFEFSGVVESLTYDIWIVAGRRVRINPETQVDPGIQVGDQVLVMVRSDDNGNLSATQIIQIGPAVTATPIPSQNPAPTDSPTLQEPDEDEFPGEDDVEQGPETEDESESEEGEDELDESEAPEEAEEEEQDGNDPREDDEDRESDDKENEDGSETETEEKEGGAD